MIYAISRVCVAITQVLTVLMFIINTRQYAVGIKKISINCSTLSVLLLQLKLIP